MIFKTAGNGAASCKMDFAEMNKDRRPSYKPRWKRIWVAYGTLLLMGLFVLFELDRAGLLVNSGSIVIDAGFALWAIGVVVFVLWTTLAVLAKALAAIGVLPVLMRILLLLGLVEKRDEHSQEF